MLCGLALTRLQTARAFRAGRTRIRHETHRTCISITPSFAALLCAAVLAVTPAARPARAPAGWPTEPVDIGRELRNAWTFHPCDDARLAQAGPRHAPGRPYPRSRTTGERETGRARRRASPGTGWSSTWARGRRARATSASPRPVNDADETS